MVLGWMGYPVIKYLHMKGSVDTEEEENLEGYGGTYWEVILNKTRSDYSKYEE